MLVKIPVSEFWKMTPRELSFAVDAEEKLIKQRMDDSITCAWLTAMWQRCKEMPKLETVLNQEKEQTPDQIAQEIIAMNARLGGSTY
jgi:hypothetical protein